ncbi:MAG: Radical domain protein [Bacteroidota bacterium]|nr:Radical domain protein [Bacteroidota bacterium]
MEHFYTLQGEGYFTGEAAYFIRLAGCDVGCVWCDVKESWTVNEEQLMLMDDLINEALKYPGRLIVITGGEPLMYDLNPFTTKLKEKGFKINIETSGAYPVSGELDWICVSPKKFKPVLKEVIQKANELKCIVYNKSDFIFAEQNRRLTTDTCELFLQPEWSKNEIVLPLIIDYIKQHPKWKISLQTHKYMNIP